MLLIVFAMGGQLQAFKVTAQSYFNSEEFKSFAHDI